MISPFLYLTVCTIKNRIVKRFTRLREPRYAIGLAIGAAYFYFFIFRNQLRYVRRGGLLLPPILEAHASTIVTVGGVALWALTLAVWLWPSSQSPISFTGAEVHFLHTSPVARWRIFNYKVLRSQVGVAFGVLVTALFSGAGAAALSGRVEPVVGLWLLLALLALVALGVGLAKHNLRLGRGRASIGTWSVIGVTAGLSLWFLGAAFARAGEFMALDGPAILWRAVEWGGQPPAALALWPFRAPLRPLVAQSIGDLVRLAWPVLLLLGLAYVWTLRSALDVEEVSIAVERRDRRGRAAFRAPASRRAPFALRPEGRAEIAVLWKNLILLGRSASPRVLAQVGIPIVLIALVLGLSRDALPVAAISGVLALCTPLIGARVLHNDLRQDMSRLAVLKTWPLRGVDLLISEMLAPAVVLTLLAWLLVAVSFASSVGTSMLSLTTGGRAAVALVAVLVLPALIVAELLIQNAAIVLFPGWVVTGSRRTRGIEAMGQNIVSMIGTLLALVLGVLPPLVVSGGIGFVLFRFVGPIGLLPAAVLFVAAIGVEVALGAAWLGRLLDRTDPTQVEAEG